MTDKLCQISNFGCIAHGFFHRIFFINNETIHTMGSVSEVFIFLLRKITMKTNVERCVICVFQYIICR